MPSRVRLEQIAPSTEHVKGYEVLNQTTPFAGSNVGPTPPIVPPSDLLYRDMQFYLTADGQTANDGGNPITVKALSDFNINLKQWGYEFPGNAADINQWVRSIQLPAAYDSSRPIIATLHIISQGASFDVTDIKAYWNMNETSGDRADATGNGHTAVEHLGAISYGTGKVDNAMRAAANDTAWLQVADSAQIQLGQVDQTLWGWMFTGSTLGTLDLFNKGKYAVTGQSLGDGIHYRISYTLFYGGAGAFVSIFSDVDARALWHFVWAEFEVISATSGTMRLYIDNVLAASTLVTGHTFITSTDPLKIGESQGPFPSDVYLIDECGIAQKIFSSPDRDCIYNAAAGSTYPNFCHA